MMICSMITTVLTSVFCLSVQQTKINSSIITKRAMGNDMGIIHGSNRFRIYTQMCFDIRSHLCKYHKIFACLAIIAKLHFMNESFGLLVGRKYEQLI